MIHKSRTRLTTKWVKSDLCGDDFLTCKNCKDKNIKIRRAYRKDYCEMWEYCPKCGAKFVKRKRGKVNDRGAEVQTGKSGYQRHS